MNLATSSRHTRAVSTIVMATQKATCCPVLVPRKPLVTMTGSCAALTWIKAGHMARWGSAYHLPWVRPNIVHVIAILTRIQWRKSSLETGGGRSPIIQGPLSQRSREELEDKGTARSDR